MSRLFTLFRQLPDDGDGVVAIEWADKLGNSLPHNRFDVLISFGGPEIRIVEVIAVGDPGNR